VVTLVNDFGHGLEVNQPIFLDEDSEADGDVVSNFLMVSGMRNTDAEVSLNEVRPADYEECRRIAWRYKDVNEPIPDDFQPAPEAE
jgi:hypothetical protein